MKKFFHPPLFFILCSCMIYSHGLHAQQKDSTIVFGSLDQIKVPQQPSGVPLNSMGADILVSTNGFGLGTFFRHEYSDETSGYVDFSISEAKDDNEVTFYDYYGNSFVPNKVNRFLLLPLYAGIQKRLFKDDILDNFRPYVNAAAGPTMIYVFPYDQEYFSALGRGRPRYTFGGYIGFGAYFGSEHSSLLGLNIRYYYIPYPGGIESLQNVMKTQFGGFYITFNVGGML